MPYVTRQLEALELFAATKRGEIPLIRAMRGAFHPPSIYRDGVEYVIGARVWERLLERGDLDILEGWGVGMQQLRITRQGLDRVARQK